MGFLGHGDVPPAGDAPEEGGDAARKMREADIRSRYRVQSSRTGKYAWLISLSIHCGVLAVGFFAFRAYLHQSDVRGQRPQAKSAGFHLFVVTSADATDAVHSFWAGPAMPPGNDSSSTDGPTSEQTTLDFDAGGHQTLTSLRDQSPAIGATSSNVGLGRLSK